MGRRRERRQGGSRRVKLDLTDEREDSPSGREISAHEDHGARKIDAHLSPKRSGVQENSLALLGQYSDDDAPDEAKASTSQSVKPTPDESQIDAQVKDFITDLEASGLLDAADAGPKKVEPPKAKKPKLPQHKKASKVTTASLPGPSSAAVILEDAGRWKAIFDEGSRDYYYWNTETGATTWNRPESCDVQEPAEEFRPDAYGVSYEGFNVTAAEVPEAQVVDYSSLTEAVYNEATTCTDSAALIQLGESVVNSFRALAGEALSSLPARVRLYVEAELRLSDCKLFAAQGSTASAFWQHTEAELRRLQSLLALEECSQSNQEAVTSKMENQEDTDMEIDMDLDEEPAAKMISCGPPSSPAATDIYLPEQQYLPPPPEETWAPSPPPEPEIISSTSGETKANEAQTNEHTNSPTSVPVSEMVAEAAAAAKNTAKLTRLKKRNTVNTLKSNKKVSSLVSKWMAAKVELHESSDEDEDDPKVLERKRQREIEEWRREQIASGNALDNANFQPLGPRDWRDRVKRTKKEQPRKKPPDLEQMSRGLAPGWKAYWDDVSEDVYYANVSKSETTWDRPVVQGQ